MSQRLINHSPDLKQLQNEGYEIEIQHGYLLVHHIPYVNSGKEIRYGVLVTDMTLVSNEKTGPPGNHVIYFQGEHPCDKEGRILQPIHHNSSNQNLFGSFQVNHSFSNKPPDGYTDYYQKIVTYADIITAPAKSMDESVTEKTFKVILDDENPVFNYIDSNSSRANIYSVAEKLAQQKVGIIGLGGTGAYILDLVAKSPVAAIHLYDGDLFLQHNAFRSPGAATVTQLEEHQKKVNYYASTYSHIHKHISHHDIFIEEENLDQLNDLSFVFLCIDRGRIKKVIMEHLLAKGISFIDTGMGVDKVDDSITGIIRVTVATKDKNDHIKNRIPISDDKEDEYNTNIQIAELNSLNAALAVIKWKKMLGFYHDLEKEYHLTYTINESQLLKDETES